MPKKVGIYSPYLDTLGGGERYVLTIAEVLSKHVKVEILLDRHLQTFDFEKLKEKIQNRLDIELTAVNFISAPVGEGSSLLKRNSFLKQFDFLFYTTDGSFFYSTAKKSYLHIQSPFPYQFKNNPWARYKISSWNGIIYNSKFTKEYAEKSWPIKGIVIYPPVDIKKIKPLKKKKQILNVGRFFGFLKEKKHEVMIRAFKEIYESGKVDEWSLHLVGSCGEGDKPYLEELKKLAEGFPVKFYPNLPFDELVKLYGESSMYWHAMGFEESDPTKQEHFGITTVEAMAGGCVPIVINKGGQREIIEDGLNGFLWNNIEELNNKTLEVAEDDKLREKISRRAVFRSKDFSKEVFSQKIIDLVEEK